MSSSKKANEKVVIPGTQRKTQKRSAPFARAALEKERGRPEKAGKGSGPEIQKPSRGVKIFTNSLRVLALLIVVAITLYVYTIRERVQEFAAFGYPGIFLIALFANATILLPAPGVAIIYAMGAIFNPFAVGLAAGTGGAIGELSGYLAGFSGQAVIERTDIYERITPWVKKYGGWAILVLSAIPNPFFDVAGIAAGIAKMPIHTFLLFAWIGQLLKMTTFALAGKYSIQILSNFIR